MIDNYQILISKIDAFIKRYYLNKIIKGVFFSILVYLIWYFLVVLLEYFGRFSSTTRTIIFISSLSLFIFIFFKFILLPFLKLLKIGKILSHKQAGKLIGEHFPEVADKLINTLELKDLLDKDNDFKDVLKASVNQRAINFNKISFLSAIDLKKNIKYLRYIIPTIAFFLILYIVYPSFFVEPTARIIHFTQHYDKPADFRFIILNDSSLVVKKGGDTKVEVRIEGKYIPDKVLINYSGNKYYMDKDSKDSFSYQFKNLNNDITFFISALDLTSPTYTIKVLPAPLIIDFNIVVKSPAYTHIEDKKYTNSGDINIAIGSEVYWNFSTSNINLLELHFDSITYKANSTVFSNEFSIKRQIFKPESYTLQLTNDYFSENYGIKYQISVIPDLYPSITAQSIKDSSLLSVLYFNGFIEDDYGFSKLNFVYQPGENSDTLIKISVPHIKGLCSQNFFFAFDFASVAVNGKSIKYYFEVFDNDAINGSKSTRTEFKEFNIPTSEELQQLTDSTNKNIETKIDEAKKISSNLKKDIEKLQKRLINEKMTSWERNQVLEQIRDNQLKLDNLVSQIKKEHSSLQKTKEQFSKNQEILKKQEELNKLIESLLDDEMRKLMEELQKMMNNFNKDEFFKLADNIKYNSEDLEKNLENSLELLKKSEVEERLKNTISQLKDLSKEQNNLSDESSKKDNKQDQLQQKQSEQSEKFNNLSEEYKKTLEKNEALQDKMNLDKFEQDIENIKQNFNQGSEELKDKKNNKASKTQKNTSQQLDEMSNKMQSMLDAEMEEENAENIEDLRQLIENLLTFSFDQEDILLAQKKLNNRDPQYRYYLIKQKNIQDNFNLIRDSLKTLASRIPELGQLTNKEVANVYKNLKIIMDEVGENRRYIIESSQQLVMTSANKLTLLLLELLEQMQDESMKQQQSSGQCNKCKKPGKSDKMGKMRNMQQGLKQQMQDMIQQLKDGGKDNQGKTSEQLAKMLMQQEMIQQMLNEMMSNNISPQSSQILKEVNQMMENNINDIINKNITPSTINRQEQILTRLLQAENSDRERELDKKRKSNEAKDYKLSNPEKAFKEKEKELRFNELLQISNIKLNTYYNNKYKEYLKKLKQE